MAELRFAIERDLGSHPGARSKDPATLRRPKRDGRLLDLLAERLQLTRCVSNVSRVSVVVCTRNRASDLTDVLAGLQSQRVHPELRWEIIVVDNGSTDDTTTVVKDYAQRAPVEVRCIREREPGLSGARNRGWRESEADVVAFLDDDCVPDPVWLQSLVDAYDAPEVASVGGRLFPLIDPDEREKIDAAWLSVYTFDAGDSPRDIEILTGANMSFRRRVLERTGGFDEQLGRIGQCLLAGDENDLCRAIRRDGAGWRILYQPEAVARHKLRPANLSDALLIKRDYCGGITNAILDRKERAGRRFILRLLRMAKRFVAALRGARHRFPGAEKSPLREIARRQEFVGYRREQSGGIELACKDCPMRPQRERRLEVLASRSAARPASSASAREDAASSEKRNS